MSGCPVNPLDCASHAVTAIGAGLVGGFVSSAWQHARSADHASQRSTASPARPA